MQQRYWMAQNLNRIANDLERVRRLLATLALASQRQAAHQIISIAKFEMGVASEFTGLGSGGGYRPYAAMVDVLEDIEDKLHNPISLTEAIQEEARLRLAIREITTRFIPEEQLKGSTKELGPEFDNKTLAQAYAEGEAIGEKLLRPDLGFRSPGNSDLHFE